MADGLIFFNFLVGTVLFQCWFSRGWVRLECWRWPVHLRCVLRRVSKWWFFLYCTWWVDLLLVRGCSILYIFWWRDSRVILVLFVCCLVRGVRFNWVSDIDPFFIVIFWGLVIVICLLCRGVLDLWLLSFLLLRQESCGWAMVNPDRWS